MEIYLFPIVLVPITSIFVLKSDKSNNLIYDSLEQKRTRLGIDQARPRE